MYAKPSDAGSSPRVRGTRCHSHTLSLACRFIPACAGNAVGRGPDRGRVPVHPRVCGERVLDVARVTTLDGSSPRVRGTPSAHCCPGACRRFIPACAGNASRFRLLARVTAVHPRVCGERVASDHRVERFSGSSPRVRGTLRIRARALTIVRFIPACAGNAPQLRDRARRPAVHPRVCGERYDRCRVDDPMTGSSPRVRGTRLRSAAALARVRFIPACAGNARPRAVIPTAAPVHPRVCGERGPHSGSGRRAAGSSPRVRGTRDLRRSRALRIRFIPACAGNAAYRRAH